MALPQLVGRASFTLLACGVLLLPTDAHAQAAQSGQSGQGTQNAQSTPSTANATEADPSAALVSALTAACKRDETQFSKYLTPGNAAAFRALPAVQRAAVLNRLSLTDDAGHPMLSTSQDGHPALRCEVAAATAEFQLGAPRAGENLAFIPVQIKGGNITDFGMVREGGGWRILSIGLVVFDIRQLAARWAEDETQSREVDAIHAVLDLQTAIGTYQRAFDQFPESLQQLGPAPKNQVSPEQANLIPAQLASGSLNGYQFRYRIVDDTDGKPSGYEISAAPEAYGKNGRRSFFLDAAGKLHGGDKRGDFATADDPVVSADQTQE
jgi:hypothetical protein